jgi:group I intron endonuclease
MVGIYKITNPKGKIYIGQSININKRKSAYKCIDKRIMGPKIYNSIRKYGWENHTFEIIEECLVDELFERESYWKIITLESQEGEWNKVLFCNLHDAGSSGPLSDHIKNKIKGKKRTLETKQKMRENKLGKPSNFKGCSHSKTTKQKMRENKLGKPSNRKKIKIFQYDLNENFVKEWESVNEIKSQLNLNKTSILNCCQNIQKKAFNYIWKYN